MTYLTRLDAEGDLHVDYVEKTSASHLAEGCVVPWSESLCKQALEVGPRRTADAQTAFANTDIAVELGVHSYIVEPVHTGSGELYGTLCGASAQRRALTEADSATLRIFARLVGQKLDQLGGRPLGTAPEQGAVADSSDESPATPGPRGGQLLTLEGRRARAAALWQQEQDSRLSGTASDSERHTIRRIGRRSSSTRRGQATTRPGRARDGVW